MWEPNLLFARWNGCFHGEACVGTTPVPLCGTAQFSPAPQRWVEWERIPSPVGTAEVATRVPEGRQKFLTEAHKARTRRHHAKNSNVSAIYILTMYHHLAVQRSLQVLLKASRRPQDRRLTLGMTFKGVQRANGPQKPNEREIQGSRFWRRFPIRAGSEQLGVVVSGFQNLPHPAGRVVRRFSAASKAERKSRVVLTRAWRPALPDLKQRKTETLERS